MKVDTAYQFLFAPSQQSVYNALIGGIRGDIEMINPSGIPYQVNYKSKGCEALLRFYKPRYRQADARIIPSDYSV